MLREREGEGDSVSPRMKEGGIKHLALYAWAHTLLACTIILCCVKKGGAAPFLPLGGTLGGRGEGEKR